MQTDGRTDRPQSRVLNATKSGLQVIKKKKKKESRFMKIKDYSFPIK
jgi:hypothetical protein